MFNEILSLSECENYNDVFDFEPFPSFKENSIDLDKNDFFLPFNPTPCPILNQEIDFEGIKTIKEYDSEKTIKIEKNKNQIDIQSTGSTKIFSSLKNKVIMENKEDINLNNESKINFKVVLHHKRGRKKSEKNQFNQKIHFSDDFDNILRKIQVSFITFLIRLSNDALKTVFGKETTYLFKDINYKHKKKINHNYIEYLKTISLGDILQMDISPKNKILKQDSNKITYFKVCKESGKLKNLFDKNYLDLFIKYYLSFIDDDKHIMEIDGFKIALSPKTETFSNLLKKNEENKEKFKEIVKNVFCSKIEYVGNKFLIDKNF
jgi:hypothetical protein